MLNDFEVATQAMRDATRLIEVQREAIAELTVALQAIVDLDDGDKPGLWPFQHEFDIARAAIAKSIGEQK